MNKCLAVVFCVVFAGCEKGSEEPVVAGEQWYAQSQVELGRKKYANTRRHMENRKEWQTGKRSPDQSFPAPIGWKRPCSASSLGILRESLKREGFHWEGRCWASRIN